MTNDAYDLAVVGGGPGGYVAAIRGAQQGMRVACIDAHTQLGGTCLRVGCIPSKALLESSERYAETREALGEHGIHVGEISVDLPRMLQRKDQIVETLSRGIRGLFRKHQIDAFQGWGRLVAPGKIQVRSPDTTDPQEIRAERIILAVGSRPAAIPGVSPDGDLIGTSSEALAYPNVPGRLVVIGAGYIGLELGSVWRRLGAEVIVLEMLDRILPGLDQEIARAAHRLLEKQGLQFRLGVRVQSVTTQEGRCHVALHEGEPLDCDRVLLAVGRQANTQQLGLESCGVQVDERGEIVLTDGFQTTAERIYAIGDCVRGPKLAHKASHEAIACVDAIAGKGGHVNYDTIPAVVYTHPEIAMVGATEEQLQQQERPYRKGTFPFQASGRARTLGLPEGQVKVLSDATTDRLLGVHIIGPRAGDLIAEAAAAMEFGASSEDLARVCHAHPTLSESLGEAAWDVQGRAVHK